MQNDSIILVLTKLCETCKRQNTSKQREFFYCALMCINYLEARHIVFFFILFFFGTITCFVPHRNWNLWYWKTTSSRSLFIVDIRTKCYNPRLGLSMSTPPPTLWLTSPATMLEDDKGLSKMDLWIHKDSFYGWLMNDKHSRQRVNNSNEVKLHKVR